jgi:hypothetical protein
MQEVRYDCISHGIKGKQVCICEMNVILLQRIVKMLAAESSRCLKCFRTAIDCISDSIKGKQVCIFKRISCALHATAD